jgi:hypothetical protein
MRINAVICKACHPDPAQRYSSAAEMLAALREAQGDLGPGSTRKI